MTNQTPGADAASTHKKYAVIYADPPWDIAQAGARGAINHYDLMTLDRIKQMPVAELAAERDAAAVDDQCRTAWSTGGYEGMGLHL